MSKAEQTAVAEKTADKANKVAEKEQEPQIISYNPIVEGSPQSVREFGKDNHSLNAKAMFAAFRHLFNEGFEKVHSNDLIKLVQKMTGVDLFALYQTDWADSPVHRGAHAISKNETSESKQGKDGITSDTFARGERALVMKEGKVGPKSKGFYYRNPAKEYPPLERGELKRELQGIIDRCKRCQ